MPRPRFIPDNFTIAIAITVALATLLPCSGTAAVYFDRITAAAISLLFFLHGAKLSREAIISGATHWRLHLVVLCCTFVLFPILGLLLKPFALTFLPSDLYIGILFLCVLPSTVQSSIALTGIAKGNVPAAICSASASNFAGIFLTPLLIGVLISKGAQSGSSFESVMAIVEQLLVPFILGQIARRWISRWVDRHKAALRIVDQGSILLVIYTAFSGAVNQGLWHKLPLSSLVAVVLTSCLLLVTVLVISTLCSRRLGFNREDEITIVLCGSKKSLASGVPMAKILFAGHSLGMIVLPIMLFHQIQLMVCAVLAQRYARRISASNLMPEAKSSTS